MDPTDRIYPTLFDYIELKSSIQLNEIDKDLIRNAFRVKYLKKRQYLLQEGDICKYMAFIVKGAGRMYTVNQTGQENIIRFAIESWWLGDYESYNMTTPSTYNIEMIEDAEVLLITRDVLQALCDQVAAVAQMVKEIDRKGTIAIQKRLQASISLGAEERYEALMNTYPEFIRRFPQNMIASYLGISPETLSRIRKKLLRT